MFEYFVSISFHYAKQHKKENKHAQLFQSNNRVEMERYL